MELLSKKEIVILRTQLPEVSIIEWLDWVSECNTKGINLYSIPFESRDGMVTFDTKTGHPVCLHFYDGENESGVSPHYYLIPPKQTCQCCGDQFYAPDKFCSSACDAQAAFLQLTD